MKKIMDSIKFNKLLQKAKYEQKFFDELYKFYYTRIIRHLEIKYGRPLAEDCAQEFFLGIIDPSKSFDYIRFPTSWVYKCCENLAKRKITYDSKYSLYGSYIEKEKSIDELIYNIERSEEIRNLLSNFDNDVKKIVYLIYWEGYNLKEASVILNITYSSVRQKYSRAMKKLKKLSQKDK